MSRGSFTRVFRLQGMVDRWTLGSRLMLISTTKSTTISLEQTSRRTCCVGEIPSIPSTYTPLKSQKMASM
uniref:Uncharacterized protein n=1 Tax=Arundo donax TaxID=35708 RepID=A0A0A8Y7K4_ARUDO